MRIDLVGKGPILFEGQALPDAAKQFDLIPFWEMLPNDTKEWLWDLHYCWGRTRRLGSKRIVKHVKLVRQNLKEQQVDAIERLRQAWPEISQIESEKIIADWYRTLDLIEGIARQKRSCAWTIIASDESLEQNLKLVIGMARKAGAFDSTPGFEFRIRSLPREKQLHCLASLSDGLSGRRQRWWEKLIDAFREGWNDDIKSSH